MRNRTQESSLTYYCPGAGRIRGTRMTIADRWRRWKARKIRNEVWRVR